MGILGELLGRRTARPAYRTIDGGHPAPYPDMTDEQLYNYETTFNVTRRTFTHPPRSVAEPTAPAREPAPAAPTPAPEAPSEPVRLRRNRAFDAPRYTARKTPAPASSGPLDFSKPVRTMTTRQPVDIITTRARHPVYKVHAYIGDSDVVSVFTLDGRLSENGPRFLENVPERRPLHLNIYEGADGGYRITQHASRKEADAAAGPDRLTCIEVKIDT